MENDDLVKERQVAHTLPELIMVEDEMPPMKKKRYQGILYSIIICTGNLPTLHARTHMNQIC